MTTPRRTVATLVSALTMFVALPAFAHGDHCHAKGADGKMADAKQFKNKKACEAGAGEWLDHHAHCHAAKDAAGKATDLPGAKDQKACRAKGGEWVDHGHEHASEGEAHEHAK